MEKSWSEGKKHEYRKFIVEDSIKKFYSFLNSKKVKGKLLDIGCGNGKNTIFFDKKGFDTLGVDFTRSALDLCRKNAKRERSKAKFKVADVIESNFKEKFEVVIDCGCLHHIRKKFWKKYLKNILNSVKKEGYFYLHGFSDNSYKLGFAPRNRNWRVKRGHYTHFFSTKEIKEVFGKYFKVIKTYEYTCLSKKFIVRAFYMQRK